MSANPTSASDHGSRHRILELAAIVLAVVLHLIVAVPFTVGLGLIAPVWAIAVAWVLWLTAAATLTMIARRRPLLSPTVPVANAVLLYGLITFGESVLGWTA